MMNVENSTAPPAGLTAGEPFVSAHGRAQVVLFLFATFAAAALFSIFSDLLQLGLIADMASGGEVAQVSVEMNDVRQAVAALLQIAVRLLLAVAFLVWLHRVTKNVPALGNPRSKINYTPGWAVGSFFIPFGNLFMPYRAVREVWDHSDPAVRTAEEAGSTLRPPRPGLVVGWWLCFVLWTFLNRASDRLAGGAETAEALRSAAWVTITSDVVGIVAAVLGIMVVRGLDRRQAERARHVVYVPNMPPPPPLFTQQQQGD